MLVLSQSVDTLVDPVLALAVVSAQALAQAAVLALVQALAATPDMTLATQLRMSRVTFQELLPTRRPSTSRARAKAATRQFNFVLIDFGLLVIVETSKH